MEGRATQFRHHCTLARGTDLYCPASTSRYVHVRTRRLASSMTRCSDFPRQTSRVASLIQTGTRALAPGTRTMRKQVQAS
jgi:hypothetical protein